MSELQNRKVVITGLGVVTPLGIGGEAFWSAVEQGKNGVGPITLFDASQYTTRFAAEVKDFNPEEFLGKKEARLTDRFVQFGLVAAELAVHDAMRLLDLEAAPKGVGGYDAVGRGPRTGKRIQIKGRAIFDESKGGQRIGQLKIEQEWDSVLLVLMNENYDPVEIYEAERNEVLEATDKTSSNRGKRGAVSVAKFKIIGHLAWSRENGVEEDEIWDNQSGR